MGQNASTPNVERSGASLTSARAELTRAAEASLLAKLHRGNMRLRSDGGSATRRLDACERRPFAATRKRTVFELRAFAAEARLGELDGRVLEADERAAEAEKRAVQPERLHETSERPRVEANAHAEDMARKYAESEARAVRAEARIVQLEARIRQLEREVAELRHELAVERTLRISLERENGILKGQSDQFLRFHAQCVGLWRRLLTVPALTRPCAHLCRRREGEQRLVGQLARIGARATVSSPTALRAAVVVLLARTCDECVGLSW